MDIKDLRSEIDEIDKGLTELFLKRMQTAEKIAEYKKENNLPIHDPERERKKLFDILNATRDNMEVYVSALYSLLFDLSCSYQESILYKGSQLSERIAGAVDETEKLFPSKAIVACQGIEGAYSQQACEKLFSTPEIMYCTTFDGVFSVINGGLCRYGILPLENSTAGSINKVYDLMMDNDFYIVRSTRLKIDHCLLAKKGSASTDIKEVFSHEQAIGQCSEFLKALGVKVTACENTAVAARTVAQSERTDIAALSSRSCAGLYGLDVLKASVQDKGNNYTRFICVSKKLEIYPGADKTSIMLSIPHKPGSLYKILSRFFALGINLIKLESRPIPDRDFEFMFYFDLETPVYSPEFAKIIDEISRNCDELRYLGSYTEVVT